MPSVTHTVDLSDPGSTGSPKQFPVGDKVKFKNDTEFSVSTFSFTSSPKTGFSPSTDPSTPIAAGDFAKRNGDQDTWTINGAKGSLYSYDFTVDDGATTLRSGTIEPT